MFAIGDVSQVLVKRLGAEGHDAQPRSMWRSKCMALTNSK